MYHEHSMRTRTIIWRTILAGLLIIPAYMALTYNRIDVNVSPALTLLVLAATTAGGLFGAVTVIRNATTDLTDDTRARVALPISGVLAALAVTCAVLALRAPTPTARGAIIGLSLGVLFAAARHLMQQTSASTDPDDGADPDTDTNLGDTDLGDTDLGGAPERA